ncbi:MAG: hypothetical protein AAGA44_13630 [Pseudomonadota bacterium]
MPPPPANTPPVLTGNLTPSFSENTIVSFILGVEDADGDTVTVTVGTSGDGQFFTLDTSTGEIRSTQPFDFENPEDANGDNVYVQTVTLNDGTTSVNREVRVSITNADEPPVCDVLAAVDVEENATGVVAVFSGTDPDAGDAASAVFEGLFFSDERVTESFALDPTTGELSIVTPLDAEAFEADLMFTAFANIRTNNLFTQCSVDLSLIDLPSRVTSGILLDTNLKDVSTLPDLDGNGIADFWVADATDGTGGGPATGQIIFGEALAARIAETGAADFSVSNLGDSERLQVQASFRIGLANATSVEVTGISDLNGDGRDDLLVASRQPPNDGIDPTRRPWAYVVFSSAIEAATGSLDVSTLLATEGFSLTGRTDFNGGNASWVVAELDGVAGDDLALSLPDALGTGAETGQLFVIAGDDLVAATGNLDFDTAAGTRFFEGSIDIDSQPVIGAISVIDDLDGDGAAELTMQSGSSAVVFPSTNVIASSGDVIDSLNPLLLELEGDAAGALEQADIDGDTVADLLLVRGDGSPNTRQASVVFGDAITPIVASDTTVTVDDVNFAIGDFVNIESAGSGQFSSPVRFRGVGDLASDGLDEAVIGLVFDANDTPGALFIIRGSTLAGRADTTFNLDNLTASDGVHILPVPRLFTSLSTEVSAVPDIDGDGHEEFYITSNQSLAGDPPGRALILMSNDVVNALQNNDAVLELEALFFNESQ